MSLPDLFESRKEFLNLLYNFIDSQRTNDLNLQNDFNDKRNVISIDADWGFGKTTFIKHLENKLKKENFTTFNFNAWKNDYEEDPLKCFISELIPQMMKAVKYDKGYDDKKEKIVKNVLVGANEILNAFTKIDILTFKKNLNEKKETLNKLLGEEESDLQIYENISPLSKAQKQFEKRLNEIYDEIEKQKKEENKNKKIVILIDELDRCRPTYAIELLERIKHLFNINQYLFIFTICRKQLKESVKQVYGNAFEETGYFRRFFDYEFYLPTPDKEEFIKQINGFYKNSEKKLILEILTNVPNISLRDLNKAHDFIDLILKSNANIINKLQPDEFSYLIMLIIIRFSDKNLFEDMLENDEIFENKLYNFDVLSKIITITSDPIIDKPPYGRISFQEGFRILTKSNIRPYYDENRNIIYKYIFEINGMNHGFKIIEDSNNQYYFCNNNFHKKQIDNLVLFGSSTIR